MSIKFDGMDEGLLHSLRILSSHVLIFPDERDNTLFHVVSVYDDLDYFEEMMKVTVQHYIKNNVLPLKLA